MTKDKEAPAAAMKSKNPVFHETAIVALGEALCVAVMLGVFALAGYWSFSVLAGGLLGGVLSVLNFFFMGVGVSNAADKAEAGDPKAGQRSIQLSYLVRTLVLAAILIAAALSKYFNLLALALPLLFVRPVLSISDFFRKAGDSNGT